MRWKSLKKLMAQWTVRSSDWSAVRQGNGWISVVSRQNEGVWGRFWYVFSPAWSYCLRENGLCDGGLSRKLAKTTISALEIMSFVLKAHSAVQQSEKRRC